MDVKNYNICKPACLHLCSLCQHVAPQLVLCPQPRIDLAELLQLQSAQRAALVTSTICICYNWCIRITASRTWP